jgi:hypothetical protein
MGLDNEAGDKATREANSNLGALRVAVPRSLGQVMREIDEFAQIFGHRWKYSIPFKKRHKNGSEETVLVEGPTVGCAIDIARCWGNCSLDCEKIEEVGDGWVFHGVFLDVEKGFRLGRPFRQRKSQNIGNMGGDRGRSEDIIFQIGASKAMRNVAVNALRGIVDEALERGQKRLTDRIEHQRDEVMAKIHDRLAENNIDEKRVHNFFGIKLEELKSHQLAQVIKMLQALQDDLIKPEEFCPGSMAPGGG